MAKVLSSPTLLKALGDDEMNVKEALKFVLGRVEYIVGKEENAADQTYIISLLLFASKGRDCVVKRYVKFHDCTWPGCRSAISILWTLILIYGSLKNVFFQPFTIR